MPPMSDIGYIRLYAINGKGRPRPSDNRWKAHCKVSTALHNVCSSMPHVGPTSIHTPANIPKWHVPYRATRRFQSLTARVK